MYSDIHVSSIIFNLQKLMYLFMYSDIHFLLSYLIYKFMYLCVYLFIYLWPARSRNLKSPEQKKKRQSDAGIVKSTSTRSDMMKGVNMFESDIHVSLIS